MKTRYKIAVLAIAAVGGSAIFGGGIGWWFMGILIGKMIARFVFAMVLAMLLYVLFYILIIIGFLAIVTI